MKARGWGGAGDATRCGDRFRDVIRSEVPEGMAVDARSIAAQGKDEEHVAEVYCLSPRRQTNLDEEGVDQVQLTVTQEEIRRLDISMGKPEVPQTTNQSQGLVDDDVIHFGMVDLLRTIDEVRHKHVFPLGRDLDDPSGCSRGDPSFGEQPKGVVLGLDETAHGEEARFVLEASIEDLSSELVPPIRSDVVHRIQLCK